MADKIQKLKKLFLKRILPMGISLAITGFVFINSYEIAFNKDLPYVGALKAVDLNIVEQAYDIDPALDNETFSATQFGIPIGLRISGEKGKIQLAPAIRADGEWLTRSSTGHTASFTTGEDTQDNMLVYMNRNVRTLQTVGEVVAGDHIFVDTLDGYRFIFRISDIQTVDSNRPYVIESNNAAKLVVIIQDQDTGLNQVLSANFITRDQI